MWWVCFFPLFLFLFVSSLELLSSVALRCDPDSEFLEGQGGEMCCYSLPTKQHTCPRAQCSNTTSLSCNKSDMNAFGGKGKPCWQIFVYIQKSKFVFNYICKLVIFHFGDNMNCRSMKAWLSKGRLRGSLIAAHKYL